MYLHYSNELFLFKLSFFENYAGDDEDEDEEMADGDDEDADLDDE